MFQATPATSGPWDVTPFADFTLEGPNGWEAASAPIVVAQSPLTLAGAATSGGTQCGCGVVYLATAGSETALYAFAGGADGASPMGVVANASGSLFGVTEQSGTHNGGTAFEITYTTSSVMETTFFQFGGKNGSTPAGPLVFGPHSALYGLTMRGGATGHGTVFRFPSVP